MVPIILGCSNIHGPFLLSSLLPTWKWTTTNLDYLHKLPWPQEPGEKEGSRKSRRHLRLKALRRDAAFSVGRGRRGGGDAINGESEDPSLHTKFISDIFPSVIESFQEFNLTPSLTHFTHSR